MARETYTATPDRLIAAHDEGEITTAQLGIALLIEHDANFAKGTVEVDGRPIDIDVGELLFSSRKFAERHRLDRQVVLRAVKRLATLGWISRRNAYGPEPSPGPDGEPTPKPSPVPPPTIIRWLRDRRLVWPAADPEPSPEPSPEPGGEPPAEPIQPVTPNPEHVSSSSSESASCGEQEALAADGTKKKPSKEEEPTTFVVDDVKRFRRELAERLGIPRLKFARDRKQVAAELVEWFNAEGYSYVLEACVQYAYRVVLERSEPLPDSLAWYANAREDISDSLPAGMVASPDVAAMKWPSGVAMFPPQSAEFWNSVVGRLTPATAAEWRRDLDEALAEQRACSDEAGKDAVWDRFVASWRKRVGMKPKAKWVA